MKAKHIYAYFILYRDYLLDNDLEDDSDTITVKNLISFVENNIDKEEIQIVINNV